jgi:hypothetical protein
VVLIRPATPGDAAGIAAVRRASWPAAYAGILPPGVSGNRRARRIYERAGFRRKGAEHPSYFAGVPEVRYVRDL